jgi:hypothetical protein
MIGLLMLSLAVPGNVIAQGHGDPAAVIEAQRVAMTKLEMMDGEWRGEASMAMPGGQQYTFTQTERVGLMLDGSVRVVEGRGYAPDGSVSFNAFAVISYDPKAETFSMRSYARGQAGDFTGTPTSDGFRWEIPAGPAKIQYTAVIKDGVWHEIGDRISPDSEPVRFFEMTLKRIGDTDWPAGGAVGPK